MKDSFPNFLLKNGWLCFRKTYVDDKWVYNLTHFDNHYSSIISGMMDFRFIKDGVEICWGLNEHHKPPTLCCYQMCKTDNEMNQLLRTKTNEEILSLFIEATKPIFI